MKKLFLSLAVALVCSFSFAQKPAFMGAMGKNLAQFGQAQSLADYQQVANKFAVIAKAEPEEWLPLYYEAQIYILMSFMDQEVENKDPYLNKAEEILNSLIEMEPQESEVYALQAFYYTGRLVVNPMERAQKMGPLSGQAIGKALAFNSKNPRARYMQIQMGFGRAQYEGGDISQYCEQAKQLLADWDNFVPESPIHPSWGKPQVEAIVANCQ